jgi:LysM repeat protein
MNMNYTQARLYQGSNRSVPCFDPRRFVNVLLVVLLGIAPVMAAADDVQLKPDRPERYTVVKGDTLWDIASRFLKSPWYWPRVWKINPTIRNPHLIYPGDVIVLRYVHGQPELPLLRNEKLTPGGVAAPAGAAPVEGTAPRQVSGVTKLEPKVYSESLDQAIPTITPDVIVPFLTQPLVVGEDELEQAGYVTVGLDNRIALGTNSEFYARGIKDPEAEYFRLFRPGKALKNPDTGEILAYEALYLGDAQRLQVGDPSKLIVTSVKQEIVPTDRLLVAPKRAALPYYFPRAPGKQVKGRIIAALNAVSEIGSNNVVTISLGQRDGMEEGHVLRVLYHQGERTDPVTHGSYELPDEDAALLMVFRTFEKVSYALVMNATQPIHLYDTVVTP